MKGFNILHIFLKSLEFLLEIVLKYVFPLFGFYMDNLLEQKQN